MTDPFIAMETIACVKKKNDAVVSCEWGLKEIVDTVGKLTFLLNCRGTKIRTSNQSTL